MKNEILINIAKDYKTPSKKGIMLYTKWKNNEKNSFY
jgi:hypothetical protein